MSQAWREQACANRFADVARRATFLGSDDPAAPCDRLQSLGPGMLISGFAGFPTETDISSH